MSDGSTTTMGWTTTDGFKNYSHPVECCPTTNLRKDYVSPDGNPCGISMVTGVAYVMCEGLNEYGYYYPDHWERAWSAPIKMTS